MTAEGLSAIEAEILRLKAEHEKVMNVGDTVAIANVARDLRYWTSRLSTAQLVEKTPGSQVTFGSCVTLERNDKTAKIYRIVGTDEADPKKGTLSYVAPLAQALMGKTVGDTVTVASHTFTVATVA